MAVWWVAIRQRGISAGCEAVPFPVKDPALGLYPAREQQIPPASLRSLVGMTRRQASTAIGMGGISAGCEAAPFPKQPYVPARLVRYLSIPFFLV
jgi:hypothetical protein